MTAHIAETCVADRPETGWAKARQVRGKGVRTCVPAVEERGELRGTEAVRDSEGNIIRGED
ncbi:hypothetical protein [Streptomyces sp. NBC_00670]|uniref:hypothetical protein n=1 Tax=Streptomyces sp. NBC_00670 TaxID=2975804 RepID=UPI002E348086|nr:hypothetical protein [Streptomyces sp. NBC_00670]